MALDTASTERLAAFRSQCFSLAKTCSMGFRSGEYSGRKNSLARERSRVGGAAVIGNCTDQSSRVRGASADGGSEMDGLGRGEATKR